MTLSRRWVLSRSAFTAAAAVTAGGLLSSPASALATVDMEMVLLAASLDPPKPDEGLTPGAYASVLAVEQALVAKGFLSSSLADGHYGTSTVSAYAAYQRSLGYTGIDANGIPGPTSLTKLGTNRYSVINTVSTGSKTDTYGGERVNTRTKNMLARADSMLSWALTLSQGSYSTTDPTSAGTHDGGGVVDISVSSMTTTQRWETVRALRTVGFAAWLRNPSQGDWPYHIHAAAVSDPDMSPTARDQIYDYYMGRNGLANHLADDTPTAYRVPFTWWEKYLRS